MKTIVSFEFQGSDTEVVAEIAAFIAKLDPTRTVVEQTKLRAPRPKRVLTETERQAIRDRFAAGKAKAALARAQVVIPAVVVDVKPEPPKQPKVFEVRPTADHIWYKEAPTDEQRDVNVLQVVLVTAQVSLQHVNSSLTRD